MTDPHKHEPNPVRDNALALALSIVWTIGMAWFVVELAGWPATFLCLALFLGGVWTHNAYANINRLTRKD